MGNSSDKSRKEFDPASRAAQYLANLMQEPVAGFAPESLEDDRDTEELILQLRNRQIAVPPFDREVKSEYRFRRIAPLLILSGLINGDTRLRDLVKERIVPASFGRVYESALLERVLLLEQEGRLDPDGLSEIEAELFTIFESAEGRIPGLPLQLGLLWHWVRVLDWEPNPDTVAKAIESVLTDAQRREHL